MADKYFAQDAKQLVDMLFDNGIFRDGLTRDDLNSIEELISYSMQLKFDSHLRAKKLFDSMKENIKTNRGADANKYRERERGIDTNENVKRGW